MEEADGGVGPVFHVVDRAVRRLSTISAGRSGRGWCCLEAAWPEPGVRSHAQRLCLACRGTSRGGEAVGYEGYSRAGHGLGPGAPGGGGTGLGRISFDRELRRNEPGAHAGGASQLYYRAGRAGEKGTASGQHSVLELERKKRVGGRQPGRCSRREQSRGQDNRGKRSACGGRRSRRPPDSTSAGQSLGRVFASSSQPAGIARHTSNRVEAGRCARVPSLGFGHGRSTLEADFASYLVASPAGRKLWQCRLLLRRGTTGPRHTLPIDDSALHAPSEGCSSRLRLSSRDKIARTGRTTDRYIRLPPMGRHLPGSPKGYPKRGAEAAPRCGYDP